MKQKPTQEEKTAIERELYKQGYTWIAGADEVGRGPLAGPVVCAAVIMPSDPALYIEGIDDSKKLSAKKREELSEKIKAVAVAYHIAEVDNVTIDEMNILQATRLCMKNAVEGLSVPPDFLLTDGNMTIAVETEQRAVVHGDALSYSIGAASILAKVYRDALMDEYAKKYPYYAFEKNKGYGTKAHTDGIREHGICTIHRKTFLKKFWAEKGNPLQ